MRERFTLRAWPLTPIHIGTGEELTPESFVLEGDRLRRFNPFGALSRASDADREQYRKLLAGGDFVGAQKLLARLAMVETAAAGPEIAVSPESRRDIQKVLDGQSIGKGGVRPMVRGGDAPILPGSSLKGALRTAWISVHVPGRQEGEIAASIDGTRTGRAHNRLNREALEMSGDGVLEQDPFRDVAVADAPIPSGRTRFDRATLGKLDKSGAGLAFDQTGGIQMHVERLESLIDGALVEPFEIAIDILPAALVDSRAKRGTREDRRANGQKRIVPKTAIGAAKLWAAVNGFHAALWRYEHQRFYPSGGAGLALQRVLAKFGLRDDETLADQLDQDGLVLVRLGRYAQFESKAVKVGGERHGVKARIKDRPAALMDEGGTRTTVQVQPGLHVPFGWLMLALPGKGPSGALTLDLSDLARTAPPAAPSGAAPGRPAAAAPVQATAAPAGRVRFRKGQRVTHPVHGDAIVLRDVGMTDRVVDVDFGDESGEWPIDGWK